MKQAVQLITLLMVVIFISCAKTFSNEVVLPENCIFAFSPRLNWVIYECNNDNVRWLAPLPNLENAVRLTIADNTLRIWSQQAWVPDGTAFLLNSYEHTEDTETWWLVNTDDLDAKILLCTLPARERILIWSPTGTAFAAVARGGDVTVVNTDGSGCETLPIPGLIMKSLSISWSPDGQKIAYTYTPYPEGPEASEVRIIDLVTHKSTTIYAKGGLPEWAPEGQKIVLFGWYGSIPIVEATGKGLIDEVKIPEGYIVKHSQGNVWSFDGSQIALYLRNDGPENEPVAIGILNLDTSTISVFEIPMFSEILGWTLGNKAIIIRMHTDKGHILKEISVAD